MTARLSSFTAALMVLAAGSLLLAQGGLRPGRYEVSMEISNAGETMPLVKDEQCIEAGDLKDLTKLLQNGAEEDNCKISGLTNTGARVTFAMTCTEDGERSESQADLRFGTDTYSGVVTTKADGEVFTTKMSGKRIGDCK